MSSIGETRLASEMDEETNTSNKMQKVEESPTSTPAPSSSSVEAAPKKPEEVPEYFESEEAFIRETPVWIETVAEDGSIKKIPNTITLVAADGVQFIVEKYLAFRLKLVCLMSEDKTQDDLSLVHHLANVTGSTLEKILAFVRHFWEYRIVDGEVVSKEPREYKKLPKPLIKHLDEYITDYEKEFLKSIGSGQESNFQKDLANLIELALAANYTQVPRLLLLTEAAMAQYCKMKDVDTMAKSFGIPNDFTEEEMKESAHPEYKHLTGF